MIGVFDSGFGGLTILKEFLGKLPQYNYIYLGDNARAPYGNKSQEVIYEYTKEAVAFLFKQGCQLVIIACNTASAKALRRIQREYLPSQYPNQRVLGVIIPVVEEAAKISQNKRIGVIGTSATVESKTYEIELKKCALNAGKNINFEIHEQSCPLLVPLVEEGWVGRPETKKVIKKYLRPLKNKKIDALILGCTHYPILFKDIKAVMGERVRILNSPAIVAEKLIDYLDRHPEIDVKLSKGREGKGEVQYFTTDNVEKFGKMGEKFLGRKIENVKKINL